MGSENSCHLRRRAGGTSTQRSDEAPRRLSPDHGLRTSGCGSSRGRRRSAVTTSETQVTSGGGTTTTTTMCCRKLSLADDEDEGISRFVEGIRHSNQIVGIKEDWIMAAKDCECRLASPGLLQLEPMAADWTLVHQCTVNEWLAGNSYVASFVEPLSMTCNGYTNIDCTSGMCIKEPIVNRLLRSSHNRSVDDLDESASGGHVAFDRHQLSDVSSSQWLPQAMDVTKQSWRRTDINNQLSNVRPEPDTGLESRQYQRDNRVGSFARLAANIGYYWIPAERQLSVVGVVCHRAGKVLLLLKPRRHTRPSAPPGLFAPRSRAVFGLLNVDDGIERKFGGPLDWLSVDYDEEDDGGVADIVDGDFSPDLTRCLIRKPIEPCSGGGNASNVPIDGRTTHYIDSSSTGSVVHVFAVSSLERLATIDLPRSGPHLVVVRFDPRHRRTRLAITGVLPQTTMNRSDVDVDDEDDDDTATAGRRCRSIDLADGSAFSVNLIALNDESRSGELPSSSCGWFVFASNANPTRAESDRLVSFGRPRDMRFSPDGHLLFVTVVRSTRCTCHVAPVEESTPSPAEFSVCVLSSSSAETLRRIDHFRSTPSPCVVHCCSSNFRPTVSRYGRYLALCASVQHSPMTTDRDQSLSGSRHGCSRSPSRCRSSTLAIDCSNIEPRRREITSDGNVARVHVYRLPIVASSPERSVFAKLAVARLLQQSPYNARTATVVIVAFEIEWCPKTLTRSSHGFHCRRH